MMDEVKRLSGWVAWPLLLSFAMIVISAFCMLLLGIWMMWGGVNGETAFAWKLALSIGAVSAFVFFVSAFIGWVMI